MSHLEAFFKHIKVGKNSSYNETVELHCSSVNKIEIALEICIIFLLKEKLICAFICSCKATLIEFNSCDFL
jgi:hypothetical protein